MSWYNYLFATFGLLGFVGALFGGAPAYARRNNASGVLLAVVLAMFWASIFYWNVYA